MAADSSSDKLGALRLAAHVAPSRQWPRLRRLWWRLCGYRAGLASSRGWREVVCTGLGGGSGRATWHVNHCAWLARQGLAYDIFRFVSRPLRAFATFASWNEKGAVLPDDVRYANQTNGWSYGVQAEAWW
mgnify:CR=1 FL=1